MKKNEKTSKRHIGALDILFGVLLAVTLLQPLLRVVWEREALPDGEELEATVLLRMRDVPAGVCDCLNVGEVLYTAEGEAYGVLEGMEQSPAQVTVESDGVRYKGLREGQERMDVTLRITVRGRMSEGRFFAEGRRAVMRGQHLTLYGMYAAAFGEVIRITAE